PRPLRLGELAAPNHRSRAARLGSLLHPHGTCGREPPLLGRPARLRRPPRRRLAGTGRQAARNLHGLCAAPLWRAGFERRLARTGNTDARDLTPMTLTSPSTTPPTQRPTMPATRPGKRRFAVKLRLLGASLAAGLWFLGLPATASASYSDRAETQAFIA